jgi:hypothetical protein
MAARKMLRASDLPAPLDDQELGFLHYLLDRAIMHNQIPSSVMTTGGMSEASKRGRDRASSGEGDDVLSRSSVGVLSENVAAFQEAMNPGSVGSVSSAWSYIEPKFNYDYASSHLSLSYPPISDGLPAGVESLQDWSSTMFCLPKYAEAKLSYEEIIKRAWNEREVMSYVAWVVAKYGSERPTAGRASDFAAFVKGIRMNVNKRLEFLKDARVRKTS